VVKKEILTIENNGPVGYLISNVLKKHYAVTRTFSCAEAMKELQSNNETDLIILDIPNDKSDNYKLLQHISTSSVLGTIRTVVISNSDDPVYLSDKVRELVNVYSNKGTRKRRIPFNLNIF
jgi:CheY-like chemotaxis protein